MYNKENKRIDKQAKDKRKEAQDAKRKYQT
jgi:hypothetical protein